MQTDIPEKSRCAITVIYVNNDAEVKGKFLGFVDVSTGRTANVH